MTDQQTTRSQSLLNQTILRQSLLNQTILRQIMLNQIIVGQNLIRQNRISMDAIEQSVLKERIAGYWSCRAEGFETQRLREYESSKKERWLAEFRKYLPADRPLKILDIGTGCRFSGHGRGEDGFSLRKF